MPRPRFDKLAPERRAQILAVAAAEFAEHGYEASSFNRIIERSGLSKGAIYYYFDDKEDLYTTVLRDALQRLVTDVGDLASVRDTAGFWSEFEAWYTRSLRAFQKEPSAIGLARSVVKAASRGVAGGALVELRRFARGWVEQFIRQGQRLGAVRTDLPLDLLTSVLTGLEEAIDLWLGERIGGMRPKEMAATAAMLTRLYRDVAEPRPGAARRAQRPKRPSDPKTTQKKRR
jgi:AcrR family transcriptional regulator